MIYVLWMILSLTLSIGGLIRYTPNYKGDDIAYPLLSDMTTILFFLPCYFILLWLLIHLINVYIKNIKAKVISIISVTTIGFIMSLSFSDFYSIPFRITASALVMAITFIHFYLTGILFKKSKFLKYSAGIRIWK